MAWHDEIMTLIYVSGQSPRDLVENIMGEKTPTLESLRKEVEDAPLKGRGLIDVSRQLAQYNAHHTPIYYGLTWVMAKISGENSIQNARRLAAFFGVLLLIAAAFFAWELFGDYRHTLIFLGLLSFSPYHLLYAQEGREYSLWALSALLSLTCLLRACRMEKRREWILFGASFFVFIQVHFLSILFLPAFLATAWWSEKRSIKKFFVWITPALAAFLFWLLLLLGARERVQENMSWISSAHFSTFTWMRSFLDQMEYLYFDSGIWPNHYFKARAPIHLLMLAASMASIWALTKLRRRNLTPLTLSLIIFPFLSTLILDLWIGLHMGLVPRFQLALYLGLQIALCAWIGQSFDGTRLTQRIASGIFLGALFTLGALSQYHLRSATSAFSKHGYESQMNSLKKILEDPKTVLVVENGRDEFSMVYRNLIALAHHQRPEISLYWLQDVASSKVKFPESSRVLVLSPSSRGEEVLKKDFPNSAPIPSANHWPNFRILQLW